MNIESTIQNIDVDNIIPNRFQPRLSFDENALKELAASIKEHGIIQPLVLRRLLNDKYEIIAGERRYKASQIAGLNKVPAIITDMDDNESAEVALIENLQRKDLSAIEEAKSYKKLLDRGYLTQEKLSQNLGISQSTLANKVRLLSLSEKVQEALMEEKISERHARSLLQITSEKDQVKMLNKIIENRFTVRQLDSEIKKYLNGDQDKVLENIEINNEEPKETETLETLDTLNEKEIIDSIEKSKKDLEQSYEIFNIPTAEESAQSTLEKTQPTKKLITGDLNSVKETIKTLENEIKNSGFQLETEEYDFEDLYQIIIKIEK